MKQVYVTKLAVLVVNRVVTLYSTLQNKHIIFWSRVKYFSIEKDDYDYIIEISHTKRFLLSNFSLILQTINLHLEFDPGL